MFPNTYRANARLQAVMPDPQEVTIGEDEWNKVVEELKNREERRTKDKDKKLDLDVE